VPEDVVACLCIKSVAELHVDPTVPHVLVPPAVAFVSSDRQPARCKSAARKPRDLVFVAQKVCSRERSPMKPPGQKSFAGGLRSMMPTEMKRLIASGEIRAPLAPLNVEASFH
jgi:hypothetical protein